MRLLKPIITCVIICIIVCTPYVEALPHDAHPMGVMLAGLNALSTFHPEQNPALQGGAIYASHDVQGRTCQILPTSFNAFEPSIRELDGVL